MQNALTVREYLDEIRAKEEVKATELQLGPKVYFVENCNIAEFEVYGVFIVDDEANVVLIGKDCGFSHVPLSALGINLFGSLEEAKDEVAKRLPGFDCILAVEMKVKKFKAYTAMCLGEILTAFYAVLDNGMVYVKDFYSCGHLMHLSSSAADEWLKQEREQSGLSGQKRMKSLPVLENMYRVKESINGWEYAEMSYPLTYVS